MSTCSRAIILVIVWSSVAGAARAQVDPIWVQVTGGLGARDEKTRAFAAADGAAAVFEGKLDGLESVDGLQSALLSALHDATDVRRQHLEDADDPNGDHFEGHEEYLNALVAIAMALVPRLPVQQQTVCLTELSRVWYAPDSYLSEWLGDRGDRVIDSLLRHVREPDSVDDAVSARVTLARIVASSAAGVRRRTPLTDVSLAHRQEALTVVLQGLTPADPAARYIVRVFRDNPSPEVLEILLTLDRRLVVDPEYKRRAPLGTSLQEDVDDAIRSIRADIH